jgi:diguanylate cyclase (GGDEF)-like protein
MPSHRNTRTNDLPQGNTKKVPQKSNGVSAGCVDLSDTLTATQRQLRAALRRNSRLSTRCRYFGQELTSLKSALEKAQDLAYYDELTGLANRRLLLERFNQASALGKRHQQQLALLFLDLDDFKSINDEFGHTTGDSVIRQAATRLCASVRASDTVCRYGGDEFVVLLSEIRKNDGALAVIEQLRGQLAMPYDVDGTSITMTLSLGVAVYPDDGDTYGDLIQQSDIAMYRSKARTRPAPKVLNGLDRLEPGTLRRRVEPGDAVRHASMHTSLTD